MVIVHSRKAFVCTCVFLSRLRKIMFGQTFYDLSVLANASRDPASKLRCVIHANPNTFVWTIWQKEACATLVTLLESCNLVEHQWHYPKSSRTCPNFDCNHRRTCSYLQPAILARISLLILVEQTMQKKKNKPNVKTCSMIFTTCIGVSNGLFRPNG